MIDYDGQKCPVERYRCTELCSCEGDRCTHDVFLRFVTLVENPGLVKIYKKEYIIS